MLSLKKKRKKKEKGGEGRKGNSRAEKGKGGARARDNQVCTCATESDRPFSCGKIALIHFPHSKSSCLQYSCHLAQ